MVSERRPCASKDRNRLILLFLDHPTTLNSTVDSKSMNYFMLTMLFISLLFTTTQALSSDENSIKLTSSGICHTQESPYFDRIKNFKAFSSIIECLDAGGRKLQSSGKIQEPNSGEYQRSKFGHGWADTDGDCQDQRAEALINTSSLPVRFANSEKCRVITGRWISPFTGAVIQNSSDIDIDHVVPLAWAWRHGAEHWPQIKRENFANDPANLWPVEASLNRSKGGSGPDEWLPPENQCQYVARFFRITKIYNLNVSESENTTFRELLSKCS